MTGSHPHPVREHLEFLVRFLRNPRRVGSIAPSSAALGRAMAGEMRFADHATLVELGPGTGAITRHVLAQVTPGVRFLAVDIDPAFCERLRQRYPALDCACASAADLPALLSARGWPSADHVVSGLPFASLPGAVSRAILAAVRDSVAPGGGFTTFQYVHAYPTPAAVAFRRRMAAEFGPRVTRRLVPGNLPPAFVLTWRKHPGR